MSKTAVNQRQSSLNEARVSSYIQDILNHKEFFFKEKKWWSKMCLRGKII